MFFNIKYLVVSKFISNFADDNKITHIINEFNAYYRR